MHPQQQLQQLQQQQQQPPQIYAQQRYSFVNGMNSMYVNPQIQYVQPKPSMVMNGIPQQIALNPPPNNEIFQQQINPPKPQQNQGSFYQPPIQPPQKISQPQPQPNNHRPMQSVLQSQINIPGVMKVQQGQQVQQKRSANTQYNNSGSNSSTSSFDEILSIEECASKIIMFITGEYNMESCLELYDKFDSYVSNSYNNCETQKIHMVYDLIRDENNDDGGEEDDENI